MFQFRRVATHIGSVGTVPHVLADAVHHMRDVGELDVQLWHLIAGGTVGTTARSHKQQAQQGKVGDITQAQGGPACRQAAQKEARPEEGPSCMPKRAVAGGLGGLGAVASERRGGTRERHAGARGQRKGRTRQAGGAAL